MNGKARLVMAVVVGVSLLLSLPLYVVAAPALGPAIPLEEELVFRWEEAPRPPTRDDRGYATTFYQCKSSLMNSWWLQSARPKGPVVGWDPEIIGSVISELLTNCGRGLISEDTGYFLELFDGFLSEEELRTIPGVIHVAEGPVYYGQYRRGTFVVRIIGELGNFACVFVRDAADPEGTSLWEKIPELYPAIDIGKMPENRWRYSPWVFDRYLLGHRTQLKGGLRTSDYEAWLCREGPSYYYGIRLDIDMKEPTLKKQMWDSRFHFQRDDVRLSGWLFRHFDAAQLPFLIYYADGSSGSSQFFSTLSELPLSGFLLLRGSIIVNSPPRKSAFDLKAEGLFLLDEVLKRTELRSEQLVLMGTGLGAGVAVDVASQRSVGGLLLIRPFDQPSELASNHDLIPPFRWLLPQKRDAVDLAFGLSLPSLVMIGESRRYPPEYGLRLYEELREPKKLLTISNANRKDFIGFEQHRTAIEEFLGSIAVSAGRN